MSRRTRRILKRTLRIVAAAPAPTGPDRVRPCDVPGWKGTLARTIANHEACRRSGITPVTASPAQYAAMLAMPAGAETAAKLARSVMMLRQWSEGDRRRASSPMLLRRVLRALPPEHRTRAVRELAGLFFDFGNDLHRVLDFVRAALGGRHREGDVFAEIIRGSIAPRGAQQREAA